MESILQGTYLIKISGDTARFFSQILYDGGGFCPPGTQTCLVSELDFQPTIENSVIAWYKENQVFQMENAGFIRREVLEEVDSSVWLVIDPLSQEPDTEGTQLEINV
ncbi:hypothetical protein QUB56_10405 [Microcoleus sp. AR_TQ3_B6]|uniref:hypothetical protein n=1 Tax=Microcoleus sp. AR_TQ3_B6 TaxID=3055284 RepID=UPI002FD6D52C